MGKSTISMAIFNCYVSSTEGMWPWMNPFPDVIHQSWWRHYCVGGIEKTFGPILDTGWQVDLEFSSHRFHLQRFLAANHRCFGIFLAYFWILKCLSLCFKMFQVHPVSKVESNVCVLGKTGRLMYLMRKPLNPSSEQLRLLTAGRWQTMFFFFFRVKVLYIVVPCCTT